MFGWPRKSRSISGSGGTRRYCMMIVSHRFSQFFNYLCFRGQGIHFWHSFWDTMFECPRKSRSTSGSRGTDDSVPIIFDKFLHYLCFWGKGIHCWHFYWATMFGWPRKSKSTSGSTGTRRYRWLYLVNFQFLQYSCFRGQGIHCWHS